MQKYLQGAVSYFLFLLSTEPTEGTGISTPSKIQTEIIAAAVTVVVLLLVLLFLVILGLVWFVSKKKKNPQAYMTFE